MQISGKVKRKSDSFYDLYRKIMCHPSLMCRKMAITARKCSLKEGGSVLITHTKRLSKSLDWRAVDVRAAIKCAGKREIPMHLSILSRVFVSMRWNPMPSRLGKRHATETERSESLAGDRACSGPGGRGGGGWAALTSAPAPIDPGEPKHRRACRLGPIEALPGPARCSRSVRQCVFSDVKRSSSCWRVTADSGGNAPSNIGLRPKPPSISFSS